MSRITRRTVTIFVSVLAMVLAMVSTALGTGAAVAAVGPPDPSKVPHYFGPWPNWANSPLTLSKASVSFDNVGSGTGATAVAQVDPKAPNGIASVDITNPGHDYAPGTTVSIGGGDTPATGTVTVSSTTVVTGFTNVQPGSGYTSFKVDLTGGGGTGATAIGSGGVDAVDVTDVGSGYTMPTVDFDYPDDPNGTQATAHAVCVVTADVQADCSHTADVPVQIESVMVDNPGSGYTSAPGVAILNGTQSDPVNLADGGTLATATTTLALGAVNVLEFGTGYTSSPDVAITDPTGTGTGASAVAVTDGGAITGVTVTDPGAGFLTPGMRKFVDDLPNLCTPPACPTAAGAKYLPTAVPAQKKYAGAMADEYVIGLVQYRTSFSSDLPPTLVRGYVQLETPDNATVSQHFPLTNANLDPTQPDTPVLIDGLQAYGVTPPQYLGPFVTATKNKPSRITFRNLLPTGAAGDLFLPVDSSMMGSGATPTSTMAPMDEKTVFDGIRNPECTKYPKPDSCFKDDRATLHLHGGTTPWISDGTPHQWITPKDELTAYPQGVSVKDVPDMKADPADPASPRCAPPRTTAARPSTTPTSRARG